MNIELEIKSLHNRLSKIHDKLDYIITLVSPKLSELQEQEVRELFIKDRELFPDITKDFDYNVDDIQPQEGFEENTDIIIKANKLI